MQATEEEHEAGRTCGRAGEDLEELLITVGTAKRKKYIVR